METITQAQAARFQKFVGEPNEEGCRPWLGHVQPGPHGEGYGRWTQDKYHRQMAHRAAWEIFYGRPIPDGMECDHLCHRRAVTEGRCSPGACAHRRCVEPTHLALEPWHVSRIKKDRYAELPLGDYERVRQLLLTAALGS